MAFRAIGVAVRQLEQNGDCLLSDVHRAWAEGCAHSDGAGLTTKRCLLWAYLPAVPAQHDAQ